MVETVTLNPALDRTLWVASIRPDDSNRITREYRYAGGKAIDVSRVLTTLGIDNRALGFVGGFTGDELEGRLLNEGIACDFVRIAGETRTNIIINDQMEGKQLIFNAEGPQVQPNELMYLIRKIEALHEPDIVVVSGSLPREINPGIYRRIIEIARAKGARVVLDTDGEPLKVGLRGRPDIIKPNIHELERLVDRSLDTLEEIIQAAHTIREQGVETVLVSMGSRGMIRVSASNVFHAIPPEVDIVNTIGAGDSSIAGYVYGLVNGFEPQKALACAVAAGAATVMRAGTALCTREDFAKLLERTTVKRIDESN
jgi:6-phosphofructokinase 2